LITRETLDRILDLIPDNYRSVLLLSKVDGIHYIEIAQMMKVKPETVLKYLSRALAHARLAQAQLDER
jgi:DNA-directed RNA polymerase specialized sigma24 family protein